MNNNHLPAISWTIKMNAFIESIVQFNKASGYYNIPKWHFQRLVVPLSNVTCKINNSHHPANTLLNAFLSLIIVKIIKTLNLMNDEVHPTTNTWKKTEYNTNKYLSSHTRESTIVNAFFRAIANLSQILIKHFSEERCEWSHRLTCSEEHLKHKISIL